MSGVRTLVTVMALAAVGCGSAEDEWTAKRPPVVPAEGVVLFRGKPVDGATVVLAPVSKNPQAFGASAKTDERGEFALSAFPPKAGAVAGDYQVMITKLISDESRDPMLATSDENYDGGDSTIAPPTINLLPKKYLSASRSGRTVSIPADGTTDIRFELQ